MVRFQQTCGPVMAKGIEDTAFYRWLRLAALNEVGGDPAHLGVTAGRAARVVQRASSATWPDAMTTLSTHDTKRSEDVRARLAVLSELPEEWASPGHRLARHDGRGPAARRWTRTPSTSSGRPSSAPGRSPPTG